MESIEIKNFGPIKHAKLDLKDINVFIGTTASGKSTVAKLVAIARDFSFVAKPTFDLFIERIIKYNIDFKITDKTYVKYCNGNFYWELKLKKIDNSGYNWAVLRFVSMFEEIALLIYNLRKPGNLIARELIRTALLSSFLLSNFDEFTKLEYGESDELPEQTKSLLSIAEEYKKQLSTDNIDSESNTAVINNLMADPRLPKILPLNDADIFPMAPQTLTTYPTQSEASMTNS